MSVNTLREALRLLRQWYYVRSACTKDEKDLKRAHKEYALLEDELLRAKSAVKEGSE